MAAKQGIGITFLIPFELVVLDVLELSWLVPRRQGGSKHQPFRNGLFLLTSRVPSHRLLVLVIV
jgi:hypothetical protein